ncbi:MAG: hypothetical protein RL283_1429 [Actinomycetota bacterium]
MAGLMRKTAGAALASIGVALMAAASGHLAIADIVDQDPPEEDGDSASATASVVTKERCIWYVTGAPDGFALTPVAGAGAEYDGTDFALAADAEAELLAYTSGNEGTGSADAHSACTFYGEATGLDVTADFSAAGFTAVATSGADVNMDFDQSVLKPLVLDLTGGTCRTPGNDGTGADAWTVGPDVTMTGTGALTAQPLMTHAIADTTAIPLDAAESNDKCNASMSLSVTIPAGKTPLYAGETYTFTGPTMTTNIDIDTTE